jgi:hypothetical protein
MADVFISYAKESRQLVEWLAAELGALGYSVWWDTELVGGRNYREVILKELADARAVIVVRTPASVRSEWVISEADRARAQRKLLPIKVPELHAHDIPPPFDVLHTENARDVTRILSALGHLAPPPNRFERMTLEQLLAIGMSSKLLAKFSDKELDQFEAALNRKRPS